ncbi:hypothetical protein K439DRAFT_1368772, partial [Ramaria rubella]
KPDYTISSAGGQIIHHLTTPRYIYRRPTSAIRLLWGRLTGRGFSLGRELITVLEPDTSLRNCWLFEGSHGQIAILLSLDVQISEFTVDHIEKTIAFDRCSAPKEIELWGQIRGKDNIAKFHVQSFQVSPKVKEIGAKFSVVIFVIKSNWGHGEYTCVYRCRVHGDGWT